MNFANRMQTAAGLTCTAAEYLELEGISATAFNVVAKDKIQDTASGLRDPALLPGAVEVAQESAYRKQQMESAAWTPQLFERMACAALNEYFRDFQSEHPTPGPGIRAFLTRFSPDVLARLAAQVQWQWKLGFEFKPELERGQS